VAWLRGCEATDLDHIYLTESVPLVGSTADFQQFSFSLVALLVGCAMIENMVYIVSNRELLQPTEEQHKCLIEWAFALSALINTTFKLFYIVSMFVTLAQLVQLLILVLMALTVDPCRTAAVVVATFTLYLYIRSSISSIRNIQKGLKQQITENYVRRQAKRQAQGTVEQLAEASKSIIAEAQNAGLTKSSLEKLEAIVDDELERAGFSTRSLVQWVCVTIACAMLLVSVIVTAQKLFFQEDQQGPAQLVASSFSSLAVVYTQIGKTRKEEKQIQKSLGKVRWCLRTLVVY
jgi:hypothetical protein